MKQIKTEIVFLLDRSGSMGGLEKSTIKGYNDFLEEQDTHDGKTLVTTVLFDDKYEIIYDREPAYCARLDSEKYYVRGCTALLDAIGKTICHIKKKIGDTPEKARAKKLYFVVTTDGLENASKEYTYSQIKKMVEKQQKKNWRFLFFGANIDAFAEGRNLGINKHFVRAFDATEEGVSDMMCDISYMIRADKDKATKDSK